MNTKYRNSSTRENSFVLEVPPGLMTEEII